MKTGLSETIQSDDALDVAAKTSPSLSMITLRFVTLLAVMIVLLTWAWSR